MDFFSCSDDLDSALKQFEECCVKYRATPWKNELTCKLIENEDAAALQKVADLSTQIHGEVNSLFDLVISFVECNKVKQARKILEVLTNSSNLRFEGILIDSLFFVQ